MQRQSSHEFMTHKKNNSSEKFRYDPSMDPNLMINFFQKKNVQQHLKKEKLKILEKSPKTKEDKRYEAELDKILRNTLKINP